MTLALALSISALSASQVQAGFFLGAMGLYLGTHCRSAHRGECRGAYDLATMGFALTVVGFLTHSDGVGYLGLPAPQSDTEGAISTDLPFLNTSDVYALGAMVRQKLDRAQVTRVSAPRAGQGYEVKLDQSEILSVISGDYSQAEIDQVVRLLD